MKMLKRTKRLKRMGSVHPREHGSKLGRQLLVITLNTRLFWKLQYGRGVASTVETISEIQEEQLGEYCQRIDGRFYTAKHGREPRHQLAVAQLLVAYLEASTILESADRKDNSAV
jgi:hypothetical protein